ncbi:acyltransferase family protein [Novipirellula galeiformis]|nr:acyltransferase [Novipirellula galeiformis]
MMTPRSQSEAANHGVAEPVWKKGSHLPELDGLRGFAILIVTLYRFGKEFPVETTAGKLIGLLLSQGDRGVELFFVLSGFLITGILIDAKNRPHYFRNFIARRSLRIFPLYFCSLLLIVVGAELLPELHEMFATPLGNQFYLWTYLVNVKMSIENEWCFGYLDHFWSLAVEEHFYFVWPLVVLCIRSTYLLRVAVGLAILSALSRIAFVLITHHGIAADVFTIFRIDALLVGSVIASLARSQRGLEPLRKWLPITLAGCATIIVSGLVLKKGLFTIPLSVWPTIWGCILVWLLTANRSDALARLFNSAALRSLGKYSYAMYVFQNPLIPMMSAVLSVAALTSSVGNPVVGHLLYIALMSSVTYMAAIVSWNLLERHFLKLKKYFPSHPAV